MQLALQFRQLVGEEHAELEKVAAHLA